VDLDAFLILGHSSDLKVFVVQRWESQLVPKWVRLARTIGRVKFFSFLTSLASGDVMGRSGSIVGRSGCGGAVFVACLLGALGSSRSARVAICPCSVSLMLCWR
jgi:hypothetical protein